ncbi:MAG: lasso peptide biosynthesis B2 protein [Acidobacteria bacterium]|nr:lasso peptide biosynthesis B2 protein [Acidobacteriota bacterium]
MRTRRPLLRARSLASVVVAAFLVRRLYGNAPLDRLAGLLRTGAPFPPALCDPGLHLENVNLLLPLLPPRGLRACFKRSLILMHLWHRCGLEPQLHLGVRPGDSGPRSGHAWVTAAGIPELEVEGDGYREAVVV